MTEIHSTSGGIEFVRTPDDRFDQLHGFPFSPSFVDVDGLRMAYIDEGPGDGPAVLLLHGEPSWSYLYRRMIPPLVAAGYRCIAPDLIGFGRSDKPTAVDAYSYNGHVAWLHSFLDAIDLPMGSRLFAQDWGGLLGLRLVVERPAQFDLVAIGNTALPTGNSLGPGFDFWLDFSQSGGINDVGALFGQAIQARELSDAEMAGYDAPFPEPVFMAGALAFPTLVPITPEHGGVAENVAAWDVLERWDKPFLTLWCPGDQVLGDLAQEFIDRIPGAAGQPHETFEPGGHFIQDDHGVEVATALLDWWDEVG